MGQSLSYAKRARRYAEAIVSGKTPAAKPTIAACKRFLDDLSRKKYKYRYDEGLANRACQFIENLPHIKGKWARQRLCIELEDWQCFVVANVFGWVDKAGQRRFRTAYIEVPRKNAKSTLAAGVALYMLTMDDEPGAEVYSAATTREQARIVWDTAKQMCLRDSEMREALGIDAKAHALWVEDSGSVFRALSAEGDTLDGLNIHCAIVDELHAHPTRKVWDVIETATGSRSQPLLFAITTAGSNRAGICYEQRDYALKVASGAVDDPSYFGVIWTIDDGDDWADPKSWSKSNPNLDVSVSREDLQRKALKAQQQAAAQPNFLTKHNNVWVNADSAWMNMRAWDRAANTELSLDQMEGKPVYIGVDLASKTDVCSVGLWFPSTNERKHRLFHMGWLPEQAVEDSDNSQYAGWVIDGYLQEVDGAAMDQDIVKQFLQDCIRRFDVKQIGFDPYQAHKLQTEMMADGAPVITVPNTVAHMSDPMKDFEALVLDGQVEHAADPVLTWMVSNVVCHVDAKDNVFPRKEFAKNKIDGVVALIMARALALRDETRDSVYNTEGVFVL